MSVDIGTICQMNIVLQNKDHRKNLCNPYAIPWAINGMLLPVQPPFSIVKIPLFLRLPIPVTKSPDGAMTVVLGEKRCIF